MKLGIAAIALSALSLIATFAFSATPWVTIAGLLFGLFVLLLGAQGRMTRTRPDIQVRNKQRDVLSMIMS